MALVRELLGKTPKIGENTFLAETAVIIGDVEMGKDCSIWYNAVIRGDVHYIKLGNKVNVQDNVMLHCTYEKFPLVIGNNVSIGHNACVHGCTIHGMYRDWETDRKSTRLNSSHRSLSRMPSSA